MTDLDPEIWNNTTLGEAGAGPFLDEVEAQTKEDYIARREGREPRIAYHVDRYPKFPPSGSVPSNITTMEMLEPGEIIPVEESLPSPVEEEESEFEDTGFTGVNLDSILNGVTNDDSNSAE